ncbi:MAG: response regulator [Sulfuritalea sp.]|nr:response regulator [Sulfuritalea sp.]
MSSSQKRRLSVLVVDDNASMRAALRAIVKSDGHDVVGEAAEGKAALKLIRQLKPDVVLLDMVMPGMDGLAVLAEIRETGVETSVLVVSGTQDQSVIQQAFTLGAMGVVTKPLNPDRILQMFEQIGIVSKPRDGEYPADAAGESSAKRCVIVDSDPGTRGMLKTLLAGEGVEVVAEAGDGMQGLCSIEEHHPDLVFLDIDMPELDGLNVLRCLRAVHPDLRVVMATANAEGAVVKEALSQRVAGYLLKPFDSARVIVAVRKALGKP